MSGMKIAIGCDHRGFRLKEELKKYLLQKGYTVLDRGTFSEESVDYPDFAEMVCASIKDGSAERGILICASGIGMSIVANKFSGIRAALALDENMAEMASAHNNANVLCLSAMYTSPERGILIVEKWLSTPFSSEERHRRRVEKISEIEKKKI